MENNKEFNIVPLWLLEQKEEDREFFYNLPFREIIKVDFEIPGKLSIGDKVAVINTEGFIGLVTDKEFSISQKLSDRIIGKVRKGYLDESFDLSFEDGSTQKIVLFSTKKYEEKIRSGIIKEIEDSEYIPAQVTGFTDWSVLLTYKGLRLEMLKKSLLPGNKFLDPRLFLVKGETIPVKLNRVKKNGKQILVDSYYRVPEPVYQKPINIEDIEKGSEFLGIVSKVTETSVFVTIGRDKDDSSTRNLPVSIACPSVSKYLEDLIVEDQIVKVKITSEDKNKDNNKKPYIQGYIEYVELHYLDDAIFEYRQMLDLWKQDNNIKDYEREVA